MVKFTEDHEWIRIEDGTATIGITEHATEQLGDLVFVELPEVGTRLSRGAEAATVESVKAASEVYAPLDGAVSAVNDAIAEDPSIVNADPAGRGWFFKLDISDPGQADDLMDEAAYKAMTTGGGA